jgi:hypothetical protein
LAVVQPPAGRKMARYRQVWDEEEQRHKLVPADAAAAVREGADVLVRGKFDAFVSPVDGSLISNQKQLDDHNKRNNVVSASEFSPEFYERKAKERARLYTGEHSKAEKQRRGEEIHRIIERLERR